MDIPYMKRYNEVGNEEMLRLLFYSVIVYNKNNYDQEVVDMKKIKRTIGLFAIMCFMAVSFTACGGKEVSENKDTTVAEETITAVETEEETKPYFEETREVVDVEVPDEVDGMRPIMIGLCKAMTGGGTYDPSDSLFYWEALYSSINGNTWVHQDISLADNGAGYMVPKAVMEAYATAMFGDASDLPDIPSNMGGVQYVEEEDSYMLYSAGGYVGNMEIETVESTDYGYDVSVAFHVKNGNIERYTFQMRNVESGAFVCSIY